MATGQSSFSSTDGTIYYDLTTDTGDRAEINDALFFQNKPDSSSGTGLIQAIVRVQDPGGGDGTEDGYNTSFRPLSYEENTSPQFTTSLLLSEVPKVTIDGVQYYEFRLDINQLNSSSLLSLDALKVYTSDVDDGLAQGTIDGAWFTANANEVYDMDGAGNTSVLLDASLSSGSGSSDLFFYVAVSEFGAVNPDDTYVTLYSQFGTTGVLDGTDGLSALDDPANTALGDDAADPNDNASAIFGTYTANDGFEEWSVSKSTGGAISGYKFEDANGNGLWDDGEVGLGGWSIDYSIEYNVGHGHNTQHVVVDGTVVTSDGTMDVNGDGVVDPEGFYSILVPSSPDNNESYTITLTEQAQAGWINTYDGDATANYTTTFTFSENDLTTTGNPASPNISGHFETTETMNFGNRLLVPHVTITKDASVPGECADTVGENILYTITVDNDGELDLTNVVVTDSFEGGAGVTITPVADDGDGILEVGEVFLTGDDGDGVLETNETWTYTYLRPVTQADIDSNGGDDDGALDNTATVNADSINGSVTDNDDASVEVCQVPELTIDKVSAIDDGGDCADEVGDIINYTVTVTNSGNVSLENVVVTDSFEGGTAVTLGPPTGDVGADGILSVGEVWTYTYNHVVTQADLDSNGGDNDGTLDNEATANADAVTTGTAAPEVSDTASEDVCQLPAITLVKNVRTDVSGAFVPADNPDGPEASTSSTVDFQVIITNTGNVTLTDVTLSDSVIHTVGGVPGAPVEIDYADLALNAFIDLDGDAMLDSGEEWANFDTNGDGTLDVDENGDPFELSVGESFTIYYSLTSLLGQHENTAVVTAGAATTGEEATANDDANYYVLPEDCVGVRTPGFWSNPKWMTFWDGTSGNEPTQAGSPGFADGELLYAIDTSKNGVVDGGDTNNTGLLIGDYNMNGITDAGEDTIFISLSDAQKLINASNKQLADGKTADGIYMLGRDVVATWLNYLANNQESGGGNCIGGVGGATNTPQEYLNAAIDWLQQFAATDNGANLNQNLANTYHDGDEQAVFQFDPRIAPNTPAWQNPFTIGEDIPVSAAAMHAALDGYNNTGAIGGEEFCCDADSELALGVLAQIHLI
jgi:uncharacterized repeat protein (TIGR01451 family)